MKVVIAIDSFKGSMTSMQAGLAAKEGILNVTNADVVVKPLADGGEGTTQALIEGLGGTFEQVEVTGPLGAKTVAHYGILADKQTAVMEMAEASGIGLVKREDLDPWKASTLGVGEMILDAIHQHGVNSFLIGIGGSATTAGGIGMLTALGYTFLDEYGTPLPPVLSSLGKIASVDEKNVPDEIKKCHFRIACDVTNPLCGDNGSIAVFGPQKGIKKEETKPADALMDHYADIVAAYTGKDHRNTPGAGAAGGLGFAFLSFLPGAELQSGIKLVLEAIQFENDLKDADIVITGEGRLDFQTAMGKVPVGVAALAKKYNCKVLAFAGSVTDEAGKCNSCGIDAFFPILRGICTLEEAMDTDTARKNMRLTVEQVFRLIS